VSELDQQLEYDLVKNFAWHHGFFAQVHKNFNPLLAAPGRENAFWYLQRRKKFGNEHEQSILKYSTAEEVYAWINEHRQQEQRAAK
jgi:hypothetical protein